MSTRHRAPFLPDALRGYGRCVLDGGSLHIDDIDLESLVLARNDSHLDGDWWFDPRTGEVLYHGVDDDTDLPALVAGVHVVVPRQPQPETDIVDFIDSLEDEGAAAELYEAYHRRGGRKRFADRVTRTSVGEHWTNFAMARESVRAIDWLIDRGLVDHESAARRRSVLADAAG